MWLLSSWSYCYCFNTKYYKYYERHTRGVTSQSDPVDTKLLEIRICFRPLMLMFLILEYHMQPVKPGGLCTVCFCLRCEGKVESWTDAPSQHARARADNVLLSAVQYTSTFFQDLPLTQTSTIGYFFLKLSCTQMEEKVLELCWFWVDFLPLPFLFMCLIFDWPNDCSNDNLIWRFQNLHKISVNDLSIQALYKCLYWW